MEKQHGFDIVGAIFVLLVVVFIGIASWRIVDNRKSDSTNQSPTSNVIKADPSAIPDSIVASYILPPGWQARACTTDTIAFLVPSEIKYGCDIRGNAQDPKSPDSAGMGVYVRNLLDLDPQSCSETLKRREGRNSAYPANEYSCLDVEIDGVKGIREVGTHTKDSFQAYGVPSTSINYIFPTPSGKMLEIGYTHYNENSYPDLTQDFDTFVRSFKFKK